MFGLPIWAIQLIIAFLKAIGAVSWASALSIKLALSIAQAFKNVKTYHENADFPHPFPGETNIHNFVNGVKPPT